MKLLSKCLWYMQWTLDGLCIHGLCTWTLYMNFIYTLDEAVFSWELRLPYKQRDNGDEEKYY